MQSLSAKSFKRSTRVWAQTAGFGPESSAVDPIAQDGMSNMGEMHPDLVGAAGLQSASKQSGHRFSISTVETIESLPMSDGRAAVLAHRLLVTGMRVAAQRCVDDALWTAGRPPNERKITALEGTFGLFGKLPAERSMGVVRLRHHQQPGSVLVEAVNDARPFDPADARKAGTALCDEGVDQGAGSVSGSRMNDQALRLVDDNDRVVFVDDLERDRFAFRLGLLGGRKRHRNYVSGFDARSRIADCVRRNFDFAGFDQGLEARTRQSRDVSGEDTVEPQACFVGGNGDCLSDAIRHGLRNVRQQARRSLHGGAAFVDPLRCHNEINTPLHECSHALIRRIDNWLLVHVEACIHEDRNSGRPAISGEDVIVKRIKVARDNLWPRRSVDMHHGRYSRSPRLPHIASYGHELARITVDARHVENFPGAFRRDYRRERHEFGSFQTVV